VKEHWINRCIEIHKFHVFQLKSEPSWTVQKTAEALQRSIGSVSQDLLIASWLKTHEKQLRRFGSMRDALSFVRARKREIRTQELEL